MLVFGHFVRLITDMILRSIKLLKHWLILSCPVERPHQTNYFTFCLHRRICYQKMWENKILWNSVLIFYLVAPFVLRILRSVTKANYKDRTMSVGTTLIVVRSFQSYDMAQ